MKISEFCSECLLRRQRKRVETIGSKLQQTEYIEKVKDIILNKHEDDTSPLLVYKFNIEYERIFGESQDFSGIKREYNDLVLALEDDIYKKIQESSDDLKEQLKTAIMFSRIGNYIDFGALSNVNKEKFLELFNDATFSKEDEDTFEKFYFECQNAKNFLLITDNCGEVVLDKLLVHVIKQVFPHLDIKILVRGSDVLNDATMEDAKYIGLDNEAPVISNGTAVAGTVYSMISNEAKSAIDSADVILAKGQGNFETMSDKGLKVYYSFLCKCDAFVQRFDVEQLTGMFIKE